MTPEQKARTHIDALLTSAGWSVQDAHSLNLSAARGVAVREFGLKPGHGAADYLLYIDQKAAGVIEAKPAGYTSRVWKPSRANTAKVCRTRCPRIANPCLSSTRHPDLKRASRT